MIRYNKKGELVIPLEAIESVSWQRGHQTNESIFTLVVADGAAVEMHNAVFAMARSKAS